MILESFDAGIIEAVLLAVIVSGEIPADTSLQFEHQDFSLSKRRHSAASFCTRGTVTALPICLYCWTRDRLSGKTNSFSGKPWRRRHSRGVSFRMPQLSW